MKSLVEREDNAAARFTNLSPVLQNPHPLEFSTENAVRTARMLVLVHSTVLVVPQKQAFTTHPNI